MSPSSRAKFSAAAAILSTTAALFTACVAFHLRHDMQSLAGINSHRKFLAERLVESERAIRAAKIKRLQSSAAAKPSRAPAMSEALQPAVLDAIKIVHTNAALEAKYLRAEKARITLDYGPFLRNLKFSADMQEHIIAALALRSQGLLDIEAEAVQRNEDLTDSDVQERIRSIYASTDAELLKLLGSPGLDQFRDYEATLNIRAVVGQLASNVYYTEHPLTADQCDKLTVAIAMAIPAGAPDYALFAKMGSIPSGVDWDTTLAEAAKILTPDQLATFQMLAELNTEGRMTNQ